LSKYVYNQTNFSKGEIGPKVLGNISSDEYANSVALMENFFPKQSGGAFKRPGTFFAGDPNQTIPGFLIPFTAGDGKQFIIIVNNSGKIYAGADRQNPVGMYNVQTGTFGVPLYPTLIVGSKIFAICKSLDINGFHYAQNGNVTVITHTSGLMEPIFIKYIADDLRFVGYDFIFCYLRHVTYLADAFNFKLGWRGIEVPYLDRNSSSITMQPNAAPAATRLTANSLFFLPSMVGSYVRVSNGTAEGLFRIDSIPTRQVATFNAGTDQIIVGTAPSTGDGCVFHSNATGVPEPLQSGKVYYAINVSGTNFKVSYTKELAVAGTAIDLGASNAPTDFYFSVEIPGLLVDGVSLLPMPAAAATDNWTISAFSDWAGFPRSCAFYESRLFFGGTIKQPDTLFGSLLNNIYIFMQKVLDQDYQAEDVEKAGTAIASPSGLPLKGYLKVTDPFSFTLAANESSIFKWLVAGKNLFFATETSEGVVSGGDSIISAQNVKVNFHSSYGGGNIQAKKIDQSLLYVDRSGRYLKDFVFIDSNGAYVSIDLTALNDEIVHHNYTYSVSNTKTNSKFIQAAYDASRSVLWLLTNNYQLVGITYDRQTKALAWHRQTLGGTNVKVKSICVVPAKTSNFDKVYFFVERSVGGVTRYYFEHLGFDFEEQGTADSVLPYLDCLESGYVNAGGIGLNKANGFAALGGATVSCIVNGKQHPNVVVTAGGEITLNANYPNGALVVCGFPYVSKLKLNPIQAGGDFGLSSGTLHRTDRVTARLYKTLGLKYSWNDVVYDEFFSDDVTVTNPSTLTLFSGEKTEFVENDYATYNQLYFKHDIPFPCNILNIVQRGMSHGG